MRKGRLSNNQLKLPIKLLYIHWQNGLLKTKTIISLIF